MEYFLRLITLIVVVSTSAQELPLPPPADPEKCLLPDIESRLDCYPEPGASEEGCISRGCCWGLSDVVIPWCYYPLDFHGYEAVNDDNLTLLERKYRSQFPGDAPLINMAFEFIPPNSLRVKLTDVENERFEPPYPKLNLNTTSMEKSNNRFKVRRGEPGESISVFDDTTGRKLFGLQDANLIFSDQFLQITSAFAMDHWYGVGEHRSSFRLNSKWTKYTLWNHDVGPRENTNLYGSHPFIFGMAGESALGLYLHNSNAMEVLLQPDSTVTARTIGGILDIFYILGSAEEVIQQYTNLIGLPAMPPYWALGFHLCRWGYGSSNNTRAVWQRMRDAKIPFDVQWNDIDYMQNNNDFTVDPVNYAGLSELVSDIHAAGMHYVAMLDPGISGSEPNGTYPPYTDAVDMDVLVKDDEGKIFVGKVWNSGSTVYPDFTHPRALEYWTKQLREFREKVEYDALWIDMNEPSNFLDGTENGCPNSTLENPPYVPPVDGSILQKKTLCMTARHAAGRHYDLHNLFSIIEADVTLKAAEDIIKKRTFLISRSTFSGIGRYAGHWSGDNYSDWPEMAASIAELLTFSLYGVPFMGADICGFGSDTSRELCNRWMQLGAFYPFSRNHNAIGTKDQDPASFDEEFIASSRKVLNIRYSLLPYLYTLMYQAHTTGSTVARPLFFEFYYEPTTFHVENAFLWGKGFYIIPVLQEGALSVEAYLPRGIWYDWYTGDQISSIGEYFTLSAPFDTIPLLIREGTILPTQEPAVTTTESRRNSFTFIVASSKEGSGTLFWDDGESLDTIASGDYGLLKLESTLNQFSTEVVYWNTSDIPKTGAVKIMGVSEPLSVTVNGKNTTFTYNENMVLFVDVDNVPLNEQLVVNWDHRK